MVVNQVLLLLLKPQQYVPAKTFATNCSVIERVVLSDLPERFGSSAGLLVSAYYIAFNLLGWQRSVQDPFGSCL